MQLKGYEEEVGDAVQDEQKQKEEKRENEDEGVEESE